MAIVRTSFASRDIDCPDGVSEPDKYLSMSNMRAKTRVVQKTKASQVPRCPGWFSEPEEASSNESLASHSTDCPLNNSEPR